MISHDYHDFFYVNSVLSCLIRSHLNSEPCVLVHWVSKARALLYSQKADGGKLGTEVGYLRDMSAKVVVYNNTRKLCPELHDKRSTLMSFENCN